MPCLHAEHHSPETEGDKSEATTIPLELDQQGTTISPPVSTMRCASKKFHNRALPSTFVRLALELVRTVRVRGGNCAQDQKCKAFGTPCFFLHSVKRGWTFQTINSLFLRWSPLQRQDCSWSCPQKIFDVDLSLERNCCVEVQWFCPLATSQLP